MGQNNELWKWFLPDIEMINNNQILCHRGFWDELSDQNSIKSFTLAFEHGFGIETDVRDYGSKLVISHDPPYQSDLMELSQLLELYKRLCSQEIVLGINIKADGLVDPIAAEIAHHGIENYFVFDMSIPELLRYRDKGLNYFTRLSDYEIMPIEVENADGIWLDAFESDWFSPEELTDLGRPSRICIVSSELHGRDHAEQWLKVKDYLLTYPQGMICTDEPLKAKEYFK